MKIVDEEEKVEKLKEHMEGLDDRLKEFCREVHVPSVLQLTSLVAKEKMFTIPFSRRRLT